METHPVIIIGAGPAGMAAAMQLQRQGISPLVFEGNRVGGLLWNANWIENYPGFVQGITGPELVELFQEQAQRLGVKITQEQVLSAAITGKTFRIATQTGKFQSNYLIAATGTLPNQLPFDKLPEEVQSRVYTEVYPLLELEGQTITIVGAGDAALDYALNLSQKNQVKIINRGSDIKGLDLLWDRVQLNPAITYLPGAEIIQAALNNKGSLALSIKHNERKLILDSDYLITAIGRKPNYRFAEKSIMVGIDKLVNDQKLFLIGDLINGGYRQTSLAVADGIRSAMIIGDLLKKGIL